MSYHLTTTTTLLIITFGGDQAAHRFLSEVFKDDSSVPDLGTVESRTQNLTEAQWAKLNTALWQMKGKKI